jgi:transposase-like protein
MAQRLDASKQSCWLDRIQRWRRSQLSIREFCQTNHLSEASFFSWRRVLRQRGLLPEPTTPTPTPTTPVASPFIKLVTPQATPPASAIEIVLAKRRRLRVRPGFDADTVRQLVRLLEEDASC